MTFTDSIKSCINKYATFKGRAPRSEYWWFILFYILVFSISYAVFAGIGYMIGSFKGMFLACLICAALIILMFFIPLLAVAVRRLHDTGRSGWWMLLSFAPQLLQPVVYFVGIGTLGLFGVIIGFAYGALTLIGAVWLFVLMLLDSDEENEYGLPVY